MGKHRGAGVAGAMYDRSQSYTSVMWGLFLILAVATVLNALLIKHGADSQGNAVKQLSDANDLQNLTSAIQAIQKSAAKITLLLLLPHGKAERFHDRQIAH